MKYVVTLILILITMQMPMSAQSGADIDSLIIELKKLPDSCKLKKIYDLANESFRNDSYEIYSSLLLKEAEKQRNNYYIGSALFLQAMYYYAKNADSMRIIMERAEPVLLRDNRLEEICRMQGWNIYSYTRGGQKEKVIPAINALKDFAKKHNFPDGEDMANQALADYYLREGLTEEGEALYEEIFQAMEKKESPLIKRITIIRHLQNSSISNKKKIYYLDKLNTYIEECKEKGMERVDAENPLYMIQYFYHRSYATIAIGLKEPDVALLHLTEAEKIVNREKLRREDRVILQIKSLYYELIGKYDLAIKLNDELMSYYERQNLTDFVMKMMFKNADLYNLKGETCDAAKIYRSLILKKDSIQKVSFYNDLAKLKTQHDMDKLELKTKQMELETSKIHSHMLIMGGGLILLVVICCLLFFIAYSRHKYGLQLKVAKEKAEEADRLKSAFLANMNHEIRTPLNAIVGFSQVLIDEENREVREKLAEIIQNNNELLQRLIADVLDISKIESNSMSFIYAEQDLPSLMKEIYSVILLRMPEHVELKLEECFPAIMETDRNRLTQILTNLLTNAIKHTRQGFIRFGYTLIDSNVRFFVQDTGEGILEEQQKRIFSRFVQLNDWSKGVGLGLAICKGLIEKMGGSIDVTSRIGEGSVFYVVLPLRNSDSDNDS